MLQSLGIPFKLVPIDLNEILQKDSTPLNNVKRLATEKCSKAFDSVDEGIVIAADTIVVLENEIISKPKSKIDAKRILQKLSGKSHFVYTGFAIGNARTKKIIVDHERTTVSFYTLTEKEIKQYIGTGSPMDKAGAYGIQDDYGMFFVKKINGCYNNVVGFPIAKIFKTLENLM